MFFAQFRIRSAAADGAGSQYFSLRNPLASGKRLLLRRIDMVMGFDGASVAAILAYEWTRFNGNDPTGGGTVVIGKRKTGAVSVVGAANIRNNTTAPLTAATGMDTDGFHTLCCPATVGSAIFVPKAFDVGRHPDFWLNEGEGILLRIPVVAVAGQEGCGEVEWEEVDGR